MATPIQALNVEHALTRRPVWRFVIGVLVVCGLLFGVFYVRGTWAVVNPVDPTASEQGTSSRLVLNADGNTEIRTTTVVPVPVAAAWRILSNYEEWERLFKTVRRKHVAEELDSNRHHVVTDVTTPLGVISLEFIVTHESTADGGYFAWWDAPTAELPVNRGTIRITPLAAEKTLLVYTVRKQYREYPQFLVNNMLFDHQTDLVHTLRERIIAAAQEQ